jgi:hypothetical protein
MKKKSLGVCVRLEFTVAVLKAKLIEKVWRRFHVGYEFFNGHFATGLPSPRLKNCVTG